MNWSLPHQNHLCHLQSEGRLRGRMQLLPGPPQAFSSFLQLFNWRPRKRWWVQGKMSMSVLLSASLTPQNILPRQNRTEWKCAGWWTLNMTYWLHIHNVSLLSSCGQRGQLAETMSHHPSELDLYHSWKQQEDRITQARQNQHKRKTESDPKFPRSLNV